MADIKVERTDGRGGTTWILAALSVIAVVAFLWWLSVKAQPTEVQVAEAADSTGTQAPIDATEVSLNQLASDVDGYRGQTIRVPDMEVASLVGQHAFWVQLPNSVPFLVKLDSTAMPSRAQLQTGSRLTVTGTVLPMSDSVLNAWVSQGTITDSQKNEASFATTFMEGRRAQVQRGGTTGQSAQQPNGQGD